MSVLFDQLRISDNAKRMYISAHVNSASYFNNVYLKSITIITADKASETTPGTPTEDYIYKKEFDGNLKNFDLVLTTTGLNEAFNNTNSGGTAINSALPIAKLAFNHSDFSKDLFFVYIECTPILDAPCELSSEITLGVTFDESILYQAVMQYTKELTSSCKVPVGFADYILLWNAFKAAVETEHYIPAIDFFNKLKGFNNTSILNITGASGGCRCHG